LTIRWYLLFFLFASNSFGVTFHTLPGIELSHPYILKINVDEIALPDSTDFQDVQAFGMTGIHFGILGAGLHAGPVFRVNSSNGIACEASLSFLWASLHRELNREYAGGISIGFIHVVSDRHYFFPVKFKIEMLKRVPFEEGLFFGGSIGFSI
jgi:hypothetical protein